MRQAFPLNVFPDDLQSARRARTGTSPSESLPKLNETMGRARPTNGTFTLVGGDKGPPRNVGAGAVPKESRAQESTLGGAAPARYLDPNG